MRSPGSARHGSLRRWRSYQSSSASADGHFPAVPAGFRPTESPASVMVSDVTEPRAVNKPGRKSARPLADLVGPALVAAFKRHGFASTEIVTHWDAIVGPD